MDENIKDLFTSYASVYSSNHQPKSSDKKNDLKQLSRFGKFIQLMADSKYKDIVSGKKTDDIDDDDWFNDDMDEYYTANYQDNRKKQLSDILSETGLDKYVTITSSYRTQPIGTAGARSYHMQKNEYGNPLAYDITPASGYSFEYMSSKLTDNKEFMNWAKANGFHINDETSAAVLRRTGGTGPHFHIGPDAFNVIKKHALGGQIESEPYDILSIRRLQQSGSLDQDWFKQQQEEQEQEQKPEESDEQHNPIQENIFDTNYTQYFTNLNWKNKFNSYKWNRFRKHFEQYATPEMKKNAGFWFALADKESSFDPAAQAKGSKRVGYFQNLGQSATNIQKQFIDADTHMKSTLANMNPKVFAIAKEQGISKTAILAASWLMGARGVKEYILAPANKKKEFDRKDGNGVHVSDYLRWFNSPLYND